jgi:hypothetical protein
MKSAAAMAAAAAIKVSSASDVSTSASSFTISAARKKFRGRIDRLVQGSIEYRV